MTNVPTRILLLLLLALIGLIDTTYLTVNHYAGTFVTCLDGNTCEEVLNSEFSMIGPVPLSMLGLFYYASVAVLTVLSIRKPALDRFMPIVTGSGLLVSAYLVWVQATILQSYCSYCLLSATVCVLLFLASWLPRNSRPAPARSVVPRTGVLKRT